MTLAILILGLVIATSFIAYWADNLGKKLGKKRISLLGIRPKQTATLISIISSVAIMLLTVGVLLAVFSNLRNALLRYDSAKRTALELRKKNAELSENINGLRSQRQTLNTQLSELQKASLRAKVQREAAAQQLAKVRDSLNALRLQLQQTAKAEKLARQGEKDAKAKAHSAQQRYAKVAQQLKDAQQKVDSSRKLLAKSLNQLRVTHQSLTKTNRDFDQARTQLAEANTQLAQTQKSLESVRHNFEMVDQQVKATLDQYREAARSVEMLRKQSEELRAQLDLRQQQLAGLQFVAYQVATGNVEVSYGAVFSQTLVPSKTSIDIARAQLQALLEAGRQVVKEKFTLSLASQPVYTGLQQGNLNAQQIIDLAARQISKSDVAVSARLVAARDHAVGEQDISTRFILVPVRTVFVKNELIDEGQIDADIGDAKIFNQLLRLVDRGEVKAREKGSMPITTPESPFYAAGTNERIFEVLRKIQTFDGSVHVRMIAAENITTIDPVQVEFEVSGTPQTTPSS